MNKSLSVLCLFAASLSISVVSTSLKSTAFAQARPRSEPTDSKDGKDKNKPAAKAERKVDCEFLEIAATSAEKGKIDAELVSLEKKLKKPPFSSWNTFKILSRSNKTLTLLKSESATLSKGAVAVLLRDVAETTKPRLGLTVTVDDAAGKRVMETKVSVDLGESFLVGRSLANNEGHVLAISCR
jgi:hypothetical protein